MKTKRLKIKHLWCKSRKLCMFHWRTTLVNWNHLSGARKWRKGKFLRRAQDMSAFWQMGWFFCLVARMMKSVWMICMRTTSEPTVGRSSQSPASNHCPGLGLEALPTWTVFTFLGATNGSRAPISMISFTLTLISKPGKRFVNPLTRVT